MIDVIYNPYGAWSLIAPVFVTVLLIIIGPDSIYKGLTIILKDRVNEKNSKNNYPCFVIRLHIYNCGHTIH